MSEESTEVPGGVTGPGGSVGEPPLPPTAAASVPSIASEPAPVGGTRPPGSGPRPDTGAPVADDPPAPRPPIDRSVRPAIIGVLVAVGALLVAERLGTPILVLFCWLIGFVGVLTALVSGNRARYRITNHPDRRRGLLGAVTALGVGVVLLVTMIAGVFLAVRSDPMGDAPLLGSSSSVERLRWGYQRFRIVQGNGWHSVARDPGSCWETDPEGRDEERRNELDRDEQPLRRISCGRPHGFEVLGVYSIEPHADVPYRQKEMLAEALRRCRDEWGTAAPEGGSYVFEYPTAPAWNRGDHDVACLLNAKIEGSVRGR